MPLFGVSCAQEKFSKSMKYRALRPFCISQTAISGEQNGFALTLMR